MGSLLFEGRIMMSKQELFVVAVRAVGPYVLTCILVPPCAEPFFTFLC